MSHWVEVDFGEFDWHSVAIIVRVDFDPALASVFVLDLIIVALIVINSRSDLQEGV